MASRKLTATQALVLQRMAIGGELVYHFYMSLLGSTGQVRAIQVEYGPDGAVEALSFVGWFQSERWSMGRETIRKATAEALRAGGYIERVKGNEMGRSCVSYELTEKGQDAAGSSDG